MTAGIHDQTGNSHGSGQAGAADFFSRGTAARVAAAVAGTGVALGALGAHSLKAVLETHPDGVANWRTAAFYHLIHAVMLWVLAVHGRREHRAVWWLMLAGIIAFSGSIYLLTTTGWTFLGPVTPLGGLCFLAGWFLLVLRPGRAA